MRIRQGLLTARRSDRGQVIPTVAMMIVVLLGFAGVVMDTGINYWNRRTMQNAVDGAALAGARRLPDDPAAAIADAYSYAAQNDVTKAEIDAVIEPNYKIEVITIFNTDDAIRVSARRQVPVSLTSLLGAGPTNVVATATALRSALMPANLAPWGIPADASKEGPVPLKVGVPQVVKGNFQPLDFPGASGGSGYQDSIMYGYQGDVPDPVDADHPWPIQSETGNMIGPTALGVGYLLSQDPDGTCTENIDCPRVVVIPLLQETWDEAKGKSDVHVVGFGAFFIDGMSVDGGSGTLTVWGHFIKPVSGVGKAAYGQDWSYSGIIGEFLYR